MDLLLERLEFLVLFADYGSLVFQIRIHFCIGFKNLLNHVGLSLVRVHILQVRKDWNFGLDPRSKDILSYLIALFLNLICTLIDLADLDKSDPLLQLRSVHFVYVILLSVSFL